MSLPPNRVVPSTLRGPDGLIVTVRTADTAWTRMVGLLGRTELPETEGLLLAPAWSIHTWFMRFPIDVVFVDRDGVVVRVVEPMGPWRLVSERRAHAVVELAAGVARRLGIRAGARVPGAGGTV
jgi:uncharacterized protein